MLPSEGVRYLKKNKPACNNFCFLPLTQKTLEIMTLQHAHTYLERLISETNKKSEIKVYEEFIQLITGLEKRDLSEADTQLIETELDALELNSNPKNRKRYVKKALSKFEKYVEDTFSLTSKGYYTKIGIGLGSSFGILFGVVVLSSFERSMGISLGLLFGMLIGLTIGRNMDAKAQAAGNVL